MVTATLKTIEQNDNVGMFSICFDDSEISEFEKFLNEFKDSLNARASQAAINPMNYVNKIIDLLLNTNKSFRQIAKELKVNYTVVQSINQGKAYYNNNIQYPIRQNKN